VVRQLVSMLMVCSMLSGGFSSNCSTFMSSSTCVGVRTEGPREQAASEGFEGGGSAEAVVVEGGA
jgi:hypothetical protein